MEVRKTKRKRGANVMQAGKMRRKDGQLWKERKEEEYEKRKEKKETKGMKEEEWEGRREEQDGWFNEVEIKWKKRTSEREGRKDEEEKERK